MALFNRGSTMHLCTADLRRSVLVLGLLVLAGACRQPNSSVKSYLKGQVAVDSAGVTVDDYSGFRVLVLRPDGRQVDTLGYAGTDRDGRFRMTITAPDRGIYSLSLWGRQGRKRLASTDYVVASGDTATLRVTLPLAQQPLRPKSPENQALRSYRNVLAIHRRMLTRRLRSDAYGFNILVQNVRLTSSTLWSLQDRYPGTYVGQFAALQSLSLLEGWNDSLVVTRARQIDPSTPRHGDAVHTARRAEARRHGHQAALDLLDTLEAQASGPQHRAGIKGARIQAFLDSMQIKAALSAAQQLRAEHPNSQWAEWASGVQYAANHLQTGMTAPNLTVRTLAGDTLSLQALQGRPVVLEYYRPGIDLYTLQRPLRNALYEFSRPDSVAFISISLEPDSLANRAFLHGRRLPGNKVIAPRGSKDPLATRYNVVHVPTWFLIDRSGKIVDQYQASALPALRQDLLRRLLDPSAVPPIPTR